MIELVAVGVVAGFLAGISPCILPVLPVILVAGSSVTAPVPANEPVTASQPVPASPVAAGGPGPGSSGGTGLTDGTGPADGTAPAEETPRGRATAAPRVGTARALAVIGGLVLSFSLLVLAGSEFLSLFHLPQDSLHDAGIALLILVGLGYLVPPLGTLLERPFARVGTRRPSGRAGGFVLGLALGVVYVPCAGPILAAITVAGATHRVGLTAVALTVAFAVGTAVPLLVLALAGGQVSGRTGFIRRHAPQARQVGGVVLVVMAVVIAFNWLSPLQRDVPGYATALQGSAAIRKQLNGLSAEPHSTLAKCNSNATGLVDCGPAPNFAKVTAWLNTPGGKPLTIKELRGKVVLVDFWTYSCINCQRALPHVEAWYKKYAKDGFVVVGVHTPEFAFEHVVSNVKAQAAALGVHYPIDVDDDYGTWDAYDNEYWPADYLIDAQGVVSHVHFGEGDYAGTEQLIRQLLTAAHPGLKLPPATDVPDRTPDGVTNPETYLGYERLEYLDDGSGSVTRNAPAVYHFPASLPPGALGLSGTWTDHSQEATAGANAELELGIEAQDVYLVLGGHGTLSVSVNGKHTQTIDVSGVPRLYTLVKGASTTTGRLLLRASSGIQAYDFTFG